jgi:asparagine synthase (glutamine-hydrolysing)
MDILGSYNLELLDPEKYLHIDTKTGNIETVTKPTIDFTIISDTEKLIIKKVAAMAEDVVLKNISCYDKVAVLFSGGVDSTTLCYILKKHKIDFRAYVVGRKDSIDVISAAKVAKNLDISLKITYITEELTEKYLPKIEQIIQTRIFSKVTDTVPAPVTIAVAIPLFFGMWDASKDGFEAVLTGIGTEEIFAGFKQWDKTKTIEELCLEKTFTIHKRDIYRDYRLAKYFHMDIIMPFLNLNLVKYALQIPVKFKINDGFKKQIWRKASQYLGVPEEFAFRPNKSTQYGSKSNDILQKLARKSGLKYKQKYVEYIYEGLSAHKYK